MISSSQISTEERDWHGSSQITPSHGRCVLDYGSWLQIPLGVKTSIIFQQLDILCDKTSRCRIPNISGHPTQPPTSVIKREKSQAFILMALLAHFSAPLQLYQENFENECLASLGSILRKYWEQSRRKWGRQRFRACGTFFVFATPSLPLWFFHQEQVSVHLSF